MSAEDEVRAATAKHLLACREVLALYDGAEDPAEKLRLSRMVSAVERRVLAQLILLRAERCRDVHKNSGRNDRPDIEGMDALIDHLKGDA